MIPPQAAQVLNHVATSRANHHDDGSPWTDEPPARRGVGPRRTCPG